MPEKGGELGGPTVVPSGVLPEKYFEKFTYNSSINAMLFLQFILNTVALKTFKNFQTFSWRVIQLERRRVPAEI